MSERFDKTDKIKIEQYAIKPINTESIEDQDNNEEEQENNIIINSSEENKKLNFNEDNSNNDNSYNNISSNNKDAKENIISNNNKDKSNNEMVESIENILNKRINQPEPEQDKNKNNIISIKNSMNVKNNNNRYYTHNNENNNNINNARNIIYMNNNQNYINNLNSTRNDIEKNNLYLPKYHEEQNRRFLINKKFSNSRAENKNNFLERMNFDIFRRQVKQQNIDNSKGLNRSKKGDKSKNTTFNRLVKEADRRLKSKQNKLNKDFISTEKINKKYNCREWNEIYKKRFKSYQENIDKKREDNRKFFEEQKKRKEDEIISLCPNKKASFQHIMDASQKMYDEAKKRRIKNEEKKMHSSHISDTDESIMRYVKKIKYDPYIFREDEDTEHENNEYINNMYNQFIIENSRGYNTNICNDINKPNRKKKAQSLIKNKKMSVSEFNNKRFDKKNKFNKTFSSKFNPKNNKNKTNENLKKNKNIVYDNGIAYNLEEERNFLIQMASKKNLQKISSLQNIALIKEDDDTYNYGIKTDRIKNNKLEGRRTYAAESDRLIYDFFMKQLDEE